jgi:hypothetical protein
MAGAKEELIRAVDAALAGDWETAHGIAQSYEGDATADWLHAVLHKIEGDTGNSRYWYRHAGHGFEDYTDVRAELAAIREAISR